MSDRTIQWTIRILALGLLAIGLAIFKEGSLAAHWLDTLLGLLLLACGSWFFAWLLFWVGMSLLFIVYEWCLEWVELYKDLSQPRP